MKTVRTTIILPEMLLEQAKMNAVYQNKTLSQLIAEALDEKVYKIEAVENPMKLLGRYKLGKDKLYTKRSDLYDEHLKRKMGL